jgi:hypothetical protein
MHNIHTTQLPGASLVVESYRAQLSESSEYSSIAGFERDMPYCCLRLPTSGGKIWLATRSVQRRRRNCAGYFIPYFICLHSPTIACSAANAPKAVGWDDEGIPTR